MAAQFVVEGILRLNDQFTGVLGSAYGEMDRAASRLRTIGSRVETIGQSMTRAISVPVALIGGGAIKMASDFESSFAGVRKTLEATDAEFAKISGSFRQMAKDIPLSVNEINRIGEAAGQLGIRKDAIVEFTRTVADLGATTTMSTEQAAFSMARLGTILQLTEADYRNFGSAIVDLGNNFAATESEISEMSLRMGAAAKIAGFTADEVVAMAAAMANVGVEAEVGGTAMQKMILRMTKTVQTGGDELKKFADVAGLTVDEFSRLFRQDASQAMLFFVKGLQGMGQQAGRAIEDVLGRANERLTRAFLSLGQGADSLEEAFQRSNTAMKDGTALGIEAGKRYETFASQLRMLWSRITDVGITLGTALIPGLKALINIANPIVDSLGKVAQIFGKLPTSVQAAVTVVGLLVVALGPLIYGIGALITAWGSATAVLPRFIALLNGATAATVANTAATATNAATVTAMNVQQVALARATGQLGGGFTAAASGAKLFGLSMTSLLGVIGLVVIAVEGLRGLLKKWQEQSDATMAAIVAAGAKVRNANDEVVRATLSGNKLIAESVEKDIRKQYTEQLKVVNKLKKQIGELEKKYKGATQEQRLYSTEFANIPKQINKAREELANAELAASGLNVQLIKAGEVTTKFMFLLSEARENEVQRVTELENAIKSALDHADELAQATLTPAQNLRKQIEDIKQGIKEGLVEAEDAAEAIATLQVQLAKEVAEQAQKSADEIEAQQARLQDKLDKIVTRSLTPYELKLKDIRDTWAELNEVVEGGLKSQTEALAILAKIILRGITLEQTPVDVGTTEAIPPPPEWGVALGQGIQQTFANGIVQGAEEAETAWGDAAVQIGQLLGDAFDVGNEGIDQMIQAATVLFATFEQMQGIGKGQGAQAGIAGAQFGAGVAQIGTGLGVFKPGGEGRYGGALTGNFGAEGAQIGAIIGAIVGAPSGNVATGAAIGGAAGGMLGSFIIKGADEALASIRQAGEQVEARSSKIEGNLKPSMDKLTSSILDSIRGIEAAIGAAINIGGGLDVKIRDDVISVFVNGITGRFKEMDDAVLFAVTELLKTSSIEGAGRNITSALKSGGFESFEELEETATLATNADNLAAGLGSVGIEMRNLEAQTRRELQIAREHNILMEDVLALNAKRVNQLGMELEASAEQFIGISSNVEGLKELKLGFEQFNASISNTQSLNGQLVSQYEAQLPTLEANLAALEAELMARGVSQDALRAHEQGLQSLAGTVDNAGEPVDELVEKLQAARTELANVSGSLSVARERLEQLPEALDMQKVVDAFTAAGSQAASTLIDMLKQVHGQNFLNAEQQQFQAEIFKLQLATQYAALLNIIAASEGLFSISEELLASIGTAVEAVLSGEVKFRGAGGGGRAQQRHALLDEVADIAARGLEPAEKIVHDFNKAVDDLHDKAKDARVSADELAAAEAQLAAERDEALRELGDTAASSISPLHDLRLRMKGIGETVSLLETDWQKLGLTLDEFNSVMADAADNTLLSIGQQVAELTGNEALALEMQQLALDLRIAQLKVEIDMFEQMKLLSTAAADRMRELINEFENKDLHVEVKTVDGTPVDNTQPSGPVDKSFLDNFNLPLRDVRMTFIQLGKDIKHLKDNADAFGLSAKEVANIIKRIGRVHFLEIGQRLAEMVNDEDALLHLQNLRHKFELAQIKIQIEMMKKLNLLSKAEQKFLDDLFDAASKLTFPPLGGGSSGSGIPGQTYPDLTNPLTGERIRGVTDPQGTFQDTLNKAYARLLELERAAKANNLSNLAQQIVSASEEFINLQNILGKSPRITKLWGEAIADIITQFHKQIDDFQNSLLFDETVSPLKLGDRFSAMFDTFKEQVSDPNQIDDALGSAQALLELGREMFPTGSASFRELFLEVNRLLDQAQEGIDGQLANAGLNIDSTALEDAIARADSARATDAERQRRLLERIANRLESVPQNNSNFY